MGYITLRGDVNEQFFSYGFDKEKSKALYCVNKQPLPNIFQCKAFKKHSAFLLNQNHESLDSSRLFMFLPSTLDRKEGIQQYSNNVNLHPIDVSYEQLRVLNNNKGFNPADLEDSNLRKGITKMFYSFMKDAAGISNHNLVRNSNPCLSSGGKIDPDFKFSCVNGTYEKNQQRFQLGY